MSDSIKRKWCYSQKPEVYSISCDRCKRQNITWSEYEHMIWCYDCEIDTEGDHGIFDGPVPVKLCKLMGIRFDRIYLKDGRIETMEDYMVSEKAQ